MAKTFTERATQATRVVQADPIRFIDRAFFLFGTIASGWLAFLLIHKLVTAGWRDLWYFIPFWLTVTYLLLPRIHTLLSRVYLPDYFIGRTRTREGVLGDPVNLALRGGADEIHTAMMRAGWHLADELDIRSGIRIVTHTLARKTYPDAPVSSLYLFGTRHEFTYQQEVAGNPKKRHHVRFWPTPDGWLLPGGTQVDWLAAGTYDRAVGLSLFTGQVTHRIAADVDTERDHIVATLTSENPEIDVKVLRNFSSGYHHRNGGGDRIETDGDLPIVDLQRVPPDPELLAALPARDVPSPKGDQVPLTVGFGSFIMLVRVVLGVVSLAALLGAGPTALAASPLFRWVFAPLPIDAGQFTFALGAGIGGFLAVYLLLAVFVYRGHSWARSWALVASTVSTAVWITAWLIGSAQRTLALNLWGTAAEIIVLLALSSDTAREFVTSRAKAARSASDEQPHGEPDDGDGARGEDGRHGERPGLG